MISQPVPRRLLLSAALAALALVVLPACAQGASQEAGFGLPTLSASEAEVTLDRAGTTAESLSGELHVEPNGCFTWTPVNRGGSPEPVWIVWPEGSRQEGDIVVLETGEQLGGGDAMGGMGAATTLADLPQGDSEDSYFGSFGRFCGADDSGVIVLSEVSAG